MNMALGMPCFVKFNGFAASTVTPWVTSATLNLAQQTPIACTTSGFSATLAPQSVTTFVGTGGVVSGAPTITTQPVNQTVTAGQTATFTVAASGAAPFSYQWQKNSINISGATSASYTAPAATTADSGSTFRCVVSNSGGSATSNAATLTVIANPPPTITSAATATPNPASVGQSVAFTVAAGDTDSDTLTYSWSFGDGATGSGASVSHAYSAAGTFTATATVSDGHGNSVSSSVSVSVTGTTTTATVVLQNGLNGYSGTADTFVNGYTGHQDANFSTSTQLRTGPVAGPFNTLVRFAIFAGEGGPVPSGATITSATLSLYRPTNYPGTLTVNRLLVNWVETQATWNRFNSSAFWNTAGATGAGTDILATPDTTLTTTNSRNTWIAMNVTTGVQAFAGGTANNGWRIVDTAGSNFNSYNSREYTTDATLRPKLSITYTSAVAAVSALTTSDSIDLGTVKVGQRMKIKLDAPGTSGKKFRWTVVDRSKLPPGVTAGGGFVRGRPKTAGTYTFQLQIKGKSTSATNTYTLTVTP